jgi:hypothetical protein
MFHSVRVYFSRNVFLINTVSYGVFLISRIILSNPFKLILKTHIDYYNIHTHTHTHTRIHNTFSGNCVLAGKKVIPSERQWSRMGVPTICICFCVRKKMSDFSCDDTVYDTVQFGPKAINSYPEISDNLVVHTNIIAILFNYVYTVVAFDLYVFRGKLVFKQDNMILCWQIDNVCLPKLTMCSLSNLPRQEGNNKL